MEAVVSAETPKNCRMVRTAWIVTPATAAGRALFLIEHPNVHPTTWDAVNQDVRDWWVTRAGPIEDAIREARP